MTPVEKVLAALPDAKRSGEGWSARCPAHDDKRASLSIGVGDDGRALLKCHAGCVNEAVVAALALAMTDLMPERSSAAPSRRPKSRETTPKAFPTANEAVKALERQHGPRAALWTYTDASREPVGVVVGWNLSDGIKDIRPVSRTGTGWVIAAMKAPRPLYLLPDLAIAERVYVVEGEKCAEAARSIGLIATTSAGGAQAAKQTDWAPLAGRDVPILPDNNRPGRAYANDVVRLLAKLTPSPMVKLVELPNLPDGGDIADFIEARRAAGVDDDGIRAEVETLVQSANPVKLDDLDCGDGPRPVLVSMADVKPEPIRWLWPGRIALGKLTLIAGDPGLGKSFITLDIAARVSRGTPFPDRREIPNPVGGVVLIGAEDDLADTVRPRLDAAGADVRRITALTAISELDPETGRKVVRPFTLADVARLEQAIKAVSECRLVVVDPVSAFLSKTDSHNNAEVRGLLAPLAELASRLGIAVVAVTHLRKGEGAALYRAMGSLAFVAAARTVWAVAKDPDDATRRLVLPVKNNVAADGTGLAYRFQTTDGQPVIGWEPEPITVTADHALNAPVDRTDGKGGALEEAVEWLRNTLADGPVAARDVKAAAKDAGISSRTLDRAKQKLAVEAGKCGFGKDAPWAWRLPQRAPTDPIVRQSETLAHYGEVGAQWGDAGAADQPIGAPVALARPEPVEVASVGNDRVDDWGTL